MAFNPWQEKGIPLDKQVRTWQQIAVRPYRKQDVDCYTRCRVILMNGIEMEMFAFSHNLARITDNDEIKQLLARTRRIEDQQQTTINWLNPPDQTVLESTIAFEQVAVDLTAWQARHEPDPYLKEVLEFGLLEDFDHLYRYSQFLDFIEGKDPDEILQGRTDVFPGRPTQDHHNDPILRLRHHYEKTKAHPWSKLHILTLLSAEQQTHNFYKAHGFQYGSPELRRLYAEIAEVEEEHVTMYESLIDPTETLLEKWLLHEFMEVANYYTCYMTEDDTRIKAIWERFLAYEIEHLQQVGVLVRRYEGREPESITGFEIHEPSRFEENREYVARVVREQVEKRLTADKGFSFVKDLPEAWPSYFYQSQVNAEGNPSEMVVRVRSVVEGQELLRAGQDLAKDAEEIRQRGLDKVSAPDTLRPDEATDHGIGQMRPHLPYSRAA